MDLGIKEMVQSLRQKLPDGCSIEYRQSESLEMDDDVKVFLPAGIESCHSVQVWDSGGYCIYTWDSLRMEMVFSPQESWGDVCSSLPLLIADESRLIGNLRFKIGDRVFYWDALSTEQLDRPQDEPSPGQRGTITGMRSDGYCTLRMDDDTEFTNVFEESLASLSETKSDL